MSRNWDWKCALKDGPDLRENSWRSREVGQLAQGHTASQD